MTKSTINPIKKSRGRPPVDSEQVNFRIQRSELDAIDTFAGGQDDKPNRTEAIRRILRDWLVGHGYLKDGE